MQLKRNFAKLQPLLHHNIWVEYGNQQCFALQRHHIFLLTEIHQNLGLLLSDRDNSSVFCKHVKGAENALIAMETSEG